MSKRPTARPRRQYGTGSIGQRADGRWMGRIDAGFTREGKRRQVTVYGRTEAEAKAKLETKRKQIAREGVSIATHTSATVRTWALRWLDLRQRRVRPKTYAADKTAVHNWIVPVLGKRKLEALGPADIRALASAQTDAGLSTSSALRTHASFVKMLRDAILEGHDVPQRVLLTEAPAKAVSDRDAMTVESAVAVLSVAATLPHGSRWATALLQGMRPSECLGLTWDRVDFDRGIITIDWQLQSLRYVNSARKDLGVRVPDGYEVRQLAGTQCLVRPKSKAGYRVIPMVPWVRAALLGWRDIAPHSPHGLVWPNVAGGPASEPHDRDEWYGLQGAAGVGHPAGRPYVRHESRHTTATLLLEAGVDPKIIQSIIGHSSIVTTRGYQHARVEQAAAALEQIAGQLQLVPAIEA
jgi:integrase